MASSKSRKRRKRRPRTPPEPAVEAAEVSETPPEPAGRQAARRGSVPPDSEAPPAPWGSFPLVELCVLAGIVMLILGFFVIGGSRGPILIAAGLALGSIGGLELSIREHFAGYKSHTTVLAGVPALIVLGLLFYLAPDGIPQLARAGIAAAVFAAAAILLTRVFSKRTGGLRYKFSAAPGRKRR